MSRPDGCASLRPGSVLIVIDDCSVIRSGIDGRNILFIGNHGYRYSHRSNPIMLCRGNIGIIVKRSMRPSRVLANIYYIVLIERLFVEISDVYIRDDLDDGLNAIACLMRVR